MNIAKIIESLKRIGLTEYESKVYLSLLKSHPSNGNMIALSSGVPGGKVYETLRRMEEKGYVNFISGGDKSNSRRYSPLPYVDLLDLFESSFKENIDLLDEELKKVSTRGDQNWMELFHINGYEASIEAIKNEIDLSNTQIILSGWSSDLQSVYEQLLNAYNRGIKITSLIFDETEIDIPWLAVNHFQIELFNKRHKGELNIVFDEKKAIILDSLPDFEHAVVSTHQSLVKTTVNYIRHDIYVNKILDDFKVELENKYGTDLDKLTDSI